MVEPGPFRTVVRWTAAGAAVPSVLVAVLGVVVAVAGPREALVSALGATMLAVLYVAPAGAVVGVGAGIVHMAVRRRRGRLPSAGVARGGPGERAPSGN